MEILSETDFRHRAEPILRQLFSNDDPYGQPFAPGVTKRIILFEYPYEMEPPFLPAIMDTALARGETGFFVSIANRPPEEEWRQPYHWYIPFADVAAYSSLVGPLNNVVFSPQASWGILGSDECHGLFGGIPEIVDAVHQAIPDLDSQVLEFLEIWKDNGNFYGSNLTWIPPLLVHVYGEAEAHRLLQQVNFPRK